MTLGGRDVFIKVSQRVIIRMELVLQRDSDVRQGKHITTVRNYSNLIFKIEFCRITPQCVHTTSLLCFFCNCILPDLTLSSPLHNFSLTFPTFCALTKLCQVQIHFLINERQETKSYSTNCEANMDKKSLQSATMHI